MWFIVQCKLTRRLVEAESVEDARLKFVTDVPMRHYLNVSDDDLDVYVATEDEVRDFQKRRRVKHIEGQSQWDLDDVRRDAPARRSNKEPA
jgi:hypothetical protein